MNILVDINHPAHVHFFRIFIFEMKKRGHNVIVTASEKDIAIELLNKYNIPHINIGKYGKTFFGKILSLFFLDLKMAFVFIKYKPDVCLGIASFRIAHSGFLFNKKVLIFDDTEHSTFEIKLYKPFISTVYTPDCFLINLGKKQIKYSGYHELAYLHPNHFKPNTDILKELNIKENDVFFVLRFISWNAGHDIGQNRFLDDEKIKLVEYLSKKGRVIITSEYKLPNNLEKYRMNISSTKMHDLLYFSTLYIGEGGTMATEAACLGVKSILINPLKAGTFEELKNKYELLYQSVDFKCVVSYLDSFFEAGDLSIKKSLNYLKFIEDKIDVSEFLIKQVE